MKQASRFKSEPEPEGGFHPHSQQERRYEFKRRESIERTYQKYEAAKALLAEWETMPQTFDAVSEIRRLRKKVAMLTAQLKYKRAEF
jgi:hypothetical protein